MIKRTIKWTEEKKEKAIEILTNYFENFGTGESIGQNDNAILYAPEILSEIVDEVLIDGEGIITDYDE